MEELFASPPKPHRTVQSIKMAKVGGADSHNVTLYTPIPVMARPQRELDITRLSRTDQGTEVEGEFQQGVSRHFAPIMLPTHVPTSGVSDNSIDMQEASGSLEGQLVDHALESVLSLPSVMSEVTSKQKFQTNEIQKQRDLLKELQRKLQTENEKTNEMTNERASLKRKIYLTEEDIARKKSVCDNLHKEMDALITANERISNEVIEIKLKTAQDEDIYTQYRAKMAESYEEISKIDPHNVEKRCIEEEIRVFDLKIKTIESEPDSQEVRTGAVERRLEEQLKIISEEQHHKDIALTEYENKIKLEQEKQRRIKQEVDVLRKRNNAQLTRLKAQVREAHQRERFFSEQAQQLEITIAELRNRSKE